MKTIKFIALFTSLLMLLVIAGCSKEESAPVATTETDKVSSGNLSDEQIDNIVRRSYQYVAMYNVNNKFAYTRVLLKY